MLVLAVIIFAAYMLWALANLKTPNPRPAYYVGELQSAELIHVARLYWSNPNLSMSFLLDKLYGYNETLRLHIKPVTYVNNWALTASGGFYETRYNNSVRFYARWEYVKIGSYKKILEGGIVKLYYNYSLTYIHNYTAPQWGSFILYPRLWDPLDLADLTYKGDGLWYVGVPADVSEYIIYDEFSIKVVVRNE